MQIGFDHRELCAKISVSQLLLYFFGHKWKICFLQNNFAKLNYPSYKSRLIQMIRVLSSKFISECPICKRPIQWIHPHDSNRKKIPCACPSLNNTYVTVLKTFSQFFAEEVFSSILGQMLTPFLTHQSKSQLGASKDAKRSFLEIERSRTTGQVERLTGKDATRSFLEIEQG